MWPALWAAVRVMGMSLMRCCCRCCFCGCQLVATLFVVILVLVGLSLYWSAHDPIEGMLRHLPWVANKP